MSNFLQTLKTAAVTIYSTICQAAVRTFPPFSAAGGNGGSLLIVNESSFHRHSRQPQKKKNARAVQRPRHVRLTKGQLISECLFYQNFSKNLEK